MNGPILVTGATGQLGRAIGRCAAARGLAVQRLDRSACDLADPASIAACLADAVPRLVINAAAWTAVDAAEADEAAASRINAEAPGEIARLCAASGAVMLHVSTDYVFDGAKGAPYVETDPTGPTGAYGRTKLAGETAVLAGCPRAIVLRTAWVYDTLGKNFLRTMLALAATRDRLRVVADQKGCPTLADDLAAAILSIAARIDAGWQEAYAGVFHACGGGETTWHGFASAIFEERARYGFAPVAVDPIATADWPTPARRPADSRLDCRKLAQVFGVALPPWRPGLDRSVGALCGHG